MHCVNGSWVPNTPGTPTPDHDQLPGQRPGHALRERQLGAEYPGGTPPPPPPPPPAHDAASCKGAPPVAGWLCAGTNWVPPNHPLAKGATPAAQVPYNDGRCQGNAPVAGWVCIRGGWLPRNHPIAIATLGG